MYFQIKFNVKTKTNGKNNLTKRQIALYIITMKQTQKTSLISRKCSKTMKNVEFCYDVRYGRSPGI